MTDSVPLTASGDYTVRLISYDPGHQIVGDSQPHEQWQLQALGADGNVMFTTEPSQDLPDDRILDSSDVGSYNFDGVARIRARHAAVGDEPNSVVPLRVSLVDENCTPPEDRLIDLGSPRLLGDGSPPDRVQVELEAGAYQIMLVSVDEEHLDPAQRTQLHEQWLLEGYDNTGSLAFQSGLTDDLPDSDVFNLTMVGHVETTVTVTSFQARHPQFEAGPGSVDAASVLFMPSWCTSCRTATGSAAPQNLIVRADQLAARSAGIRWQPPSDKSTLASYRLYLDGKLVSEADGTRRGFIFNEIEPETYYTFGVSAVDASGVESEVIAAGAMTLSDALGGQSGTAAQVVYFGQNLQGKFELDIEVVVNAPNDGSIAVQIDLPDWVSSPVQASVAGGPLWGCTKPEAPYREMECEVGYDTDKRSTSLRLIFDRPQLPTQEQYTATIQNEPAAIVAVVPFDGEPNLLDNVIVADLLPRPPKQPTLTASGYKVGNGPQQVLSYFVQWGAPSRWGPQCPSSNSDGTYILYKAEYSAGESKFTGTPAEHLVEYKNIGNRRIVGDYYVTVRCEDGIESPPSPVLAVDIEPNETPNLAYFDEDGDGVPDTVNAVTDQFPPGTTWYFKDPALLTDGIEVTKQGGIPEHQLAMMDIIPFAFVDSVAKYGQDLAPVVTAAGAGGASVTALLGGVTIGAALIAVFAAVVVVVGVFLIVYVLFAGDKTPAVPDTEDNRREAIRLDGGTQLADQNAVAKLAIVLQVSVEIGTNAATALANECIRLLKKSGLEGYDANGENKCATLPIYFPSRKDIHEAANLRRDAIRVHPFWILQQRRKAISPTALRRAWYRGKPWEDGAVISVEAAKGCQGDTPDRSDCDEFPNQAMYAGRSRLNPDAQPQPAIRYLDLSDNRREGRFLRSLYEDKNCAPEGETQMVDGQFFLVVPLPRLFSLFLPTFHVC